jgi:hypothetical protein
MNSINSYKITMIFCNKSMMNTLKKQRLQLEILISKQLSDLSMMYLVSANINQIKK